MADTLPDVTITTGWNDLYQLSGIVQGTPLILKNKSSLPILIVISAAIPNPNFSGGWDIAGSDWVTVTGIPTGSRVWAKGNGKLMVQVDE